MRAWVVAQAAQYMANEGLEEVTSDVKDYVYDAFAEEDISKRDLKAIVKTLEEDLQNV